jgi:Ca2+-binding RTX toxin-like protein
MTTDLSLAQISVGEQRAIGAVPLSGDRVLYFWQDSSLSGADQDGSCVMARLFTLAGEADGDSFVVNITTEGNQIFPAATSLGGGQSLLTWIQKNSVSSLHDAVHYRYVDENGALSNREYSIRNPNPSLYLDFRAMIERPDGSFSVIWKSRGFGDGDAYIQHVTRNGRPRGEIELLVSDGAHTAQETVLVKATETGFLTYWNNYQSGVRLQFHSFDGEELSPVIQTSVRFTSGSPGYDVESLEGGNVVVLSRYFVEIVSNSWRTSIEAEILSPDGQRVGSPFQVDLRSTGSLQSVNTFDVAALSDGGFLAVWSDRLTLDLYMRRFDSQGDEIGIASRVNVGEYTNVPGSLSVTELQDGRVAISWAQYQGQYDVLSRIVNLDFRKPIEVGGETVANDGDSYYAAGGGFLYQDTTTIPGQSFHLAEDWNRDGAEDEGDKVFAFGTGTVDHRGAMNGYGKTIILDHGVKSEGGAHLYSLYAHLKDYASTEETAYDMGESIGFLGRTGGKWQPHLHFEVFEALSSSHGIAMGGGWLTQSEFDNAQNVTFDADGRPTSIFLQSGSGQSMKFARWFSSDYFIDEASTRVRIYDLNSTNAISVIARLGTERYEIFGLSGRDVIQAGNQSDLLSGGSGNDRLFGYGGGDTIYGDAGDDAIFGGIGADTLTGGEGSDIFVFGNGSSVGTADLILDFNALQDTIELKNSAFRGLEIGVLSDAIFAVNNSGEATDAVHRIIYESDTGRLFYDRDGTGLAVRAHFATVSSDLDITGLDFIVS